MYFELRIVTSNEKKGRNKKENRLHESFHYLLWTAFPSNDLEDETFPETDFRIFPIPEKTKLDNLLLIFQNIWSVIQEAFKFWLSPATD